MKKFVPTLFWSLFLGLVLFSIKFAWYVPEEHLWTLFVSLFLPLAGCLIASYAIYQTIYAYMASHKWGCLHWDIYATLCNPDAYKKQEIDRLIRSIDEYLILNEGILKMFLARVTVAKVILPAARKNIIELGRILNERRGKPM